MPALRLVLWFATAAAAGFLFAWLLDVRGSSQSRAGADRPQGPEEEAESRLATADGGGGGVPALVAAPAEAAATASTRDATSVPTAAWPEPPPPGEGGWVEVEVRGLEPGAEGEAYLLPAGGASPSDAADMAYGVVGPGRPARLRALADGRYDVGFVCDAFRLLETDVWIGSGKTIPLRLVAPALDFVEFVIEALPPPGPSGTNVVARLRAGADGGSQYPGRQEAWESAHSRTVSAPGTVRLGPIARDQVARADVSVLDLDPTESGNGVWRFSRRVVARCEPAQVRGGDRVRVRFVEAAPLTVIATTDRSWPAGAWAEVEMRLEHAAGTHEGHMGFMGAEVGEPSGAQRVEFLGVAGPARLVWQGPAVRPGRLDGIVLVSGEAQERSVTLEWAGQASPAQPGEPLAIEAVLPVGPLDADDELAVAARPSAGEGASEGWYEDWSLGPGAGPFEVDGAWRRASHLVVSIGERWVSAPLPVPARGPLRATFGVGGHLVVVLERPWAGESAGRPRLRRADGLMLRAKGPDLDGYQAAPPVTSGVVLGPLWPGEHEFDLVVGGRAVRRVKATVRAGRTGALLVP